MKVDGATVKYFTAVFSVLVLLTKPKQLILKILPVKTEKTYGSIFIWSKSSSLVIVHARAHDEHQYELCYK